MNRSALSIANVLISAVRRLLLLQDPPHNHPPPLSCAFHTHYLIASIYTRLALDLSISCLLPFLPLRTVCQVSFTSDGSIWSLLIFHTIHSPNNGTALIVDNLLLMAISAVWERDNGACVGFMLISHISHARLRVLLLLVSQTNNTEQAPIQ